MTVEISHQGVIRDKIIIYKVPSTLTILHVVPKVLKLRHCKVASFFVKVARHSAETLWPLGRPSCDGD